MNVQYGFIKVNNKIEKIEGNDKVNANKDNLIVCPNEFGLYNNYVMKFPPFMRERFYLTKTDCNVDLCMFEEIEYLWENEVLTQGCCCGHGLLEGMINVYSSDDANKMFELGYKLVPNLVGHEFAPYTFLPKSKHVEDGIYIKY